jgi:hypothetical protein
VLQQHISARHRDGVEDDSGLSENNIEQFREGLRIRQPQLPQPRFDGPRESACAASLASMSRVTLDVDFKELLTHGSLMQKPPAV